MTVLSQHVFDRCVPGPGNCVVFVKTRNRKGYGRVEHKGKRHLAHRVAYEAMVGPIPEGLVIDHLCRNPSCCNPAHLEPVTVRENTVRGLSPDATKSRHAAQTHCKRGHERTPDNQYKGECRTCVADMQRQRRAKAKAAKGL